MSKQPVIYSMRRCDQIVAYVAVMPNGKCIVSWPTSTIVYDSEQSARDIHIKHMGGRGEKTSFNIALACPAFLRGSQNCIQDSYEGCPDASGPRAPHYIPSDQAEDYEAGYLSTARAIYGEGYVADESRWQGAPKAGEEGGREQRGEQR